MKRVLSDKECKQCHILFRRKNHYNIYCSVSCRGLFDRGKTKKRKGRNINCATCDEVFYVEPFGLKDTRRKKIYCSTSCAHSNKLRRRRISISVKKNPTRYWLNKKRPMIAGKNHYLWRGGKSDENKKIRDSLEYTMWRRSVFRRDNYTCVFCGVKSGNGKRVYLEADHIKPFAYFPKLRLDINNGRTLCKECHKKTDTYMGRASRLYSPNPSGLRWEEVTIIQ